MNVLLLCSNKRWGFWPMHQRLNIDGHFKLPSHCSLCPALPAPSPPHHYPLSLPADPREYKNKEAAGQLRKSPCTFPGIGSTSPLLFLARKYAILDGPGFPIVAEGEEEPNDTYVEQLTDCARAAVEELQRRGVAHPARIAVGGHSYGAFMTANLLAHAGDLFACGIARSGAYNRTLTPMGFQAEERTYWQVGGREGGRWVGGWVGGAGGTDGPTGWRAACLASERASEL